MEIPIDVNYCWALRCPYPPKSTEGRAAIVNLTTPAQLGAVISGDTHAMRSVGITDEVDARDVVVIALLGAAQGEKKDTAPLVNTPARL